MALGLVAAALGLAMAAAAGSVDPAGILSWSGTAGVIATWFPANTIILPGTLVAVGAAVTGIGIFTFASDRTSLGPQLAAAAGSTDLPGIEKWTNVAGALLDFITLCGQPTPTAFVANPLGGPVTGVGTVAFANTLIGPVLAAAAGSLDAPGIAGWTSVGGVILAQFVAAAQFIPVFASPPGGGPLTGVGAIL